MYCKDYDVDKMRGMSYGMKKWHLRENQYVSMVLSAVEIVLFEMNQAKLNGIFRQVLSVQNKFVVMPTTSFHPLTTHTHIIHSAYECVRIYVLLKTCYCVQTEFEKDLKGRNSQAMCFIEVVFTWREKKMNEIFV